MAETTTSPVRLSIGSTLDAVGVIERRPAIRRRAGGEAEESYRRAALFVSKMVANGRRSILFCSARRGEGTTTAVVNLAHQLHESYGLRPLLIELPRQKPAFAKLFRLDPGGHTVDEALTGEQQPIDCVQTTASGLFVIPAALPHRGEAHPGPLAGLGPLVKELERLFDVILIDAPALLAHADAIIAATFVSGVILVVESGRTSYEVLEQIKGELAIEEIAIAGTVLVKHRRFIPGWLYWWLTR